MSEIVSRRDFLKVVVVGTGTVIIQSCAPEPLKPSNIIPSLTTAPLLPTKTQEPTSVPLPPIEAKQWAVNNKTGRIDSEQLYPYVGDWVLTTPQGEKLTSSKKRAVDLEWSGLKLVYVGDKDVQQAGFDQNAYRSHIAEKLNNQIELKGRLSEIKEKLPGQDLVPALLTIIINGPDFSNQIPNIAAGLNESNSVVTGIASSLGEFPKWYVLNKDLLRLNKDQEPLLQPFLISEGGKYIRTDSGEEVMMEGKNIMNFHFRPVKIRMSEVRNQLQDLRNSGENFLAINWNAAFATDQSYVQKLAETLMLAKYQHGFRVMLALSDNGLKKGSSYDSEVIRVPDEHISEYWKSLLYFEDNLNIYLGEENFASLAKRTVDVFDIISEPNGNFTFFNPHLDAACNDIRTAVGDQAICGFSDGDWFATDAVELLSTDENGVSLAQKFVDTHPNSTVVIHPFILDNPKDPNDPLRSERPDPMLYLHLLKAKGVNVTVGESGWKDWDMNPDWLRNFRQYCRDNRISIALDPDPD